MTAWNPRQRDREINQCIHELLAERAALKAQVHELTVLLEVAEQLTRAHQTCPTAAL